MLKTREMVEVSFRVDISIPKTKFPIFEYLEVSLAGLLIWVSIPIPTVLPLVILSIGSVSALLLKTSILEGYRNCISILDTRSILQYWYFICVYNIVWHHFNTGLQILIQNICVGNFFLISWFGVRKWKFLISVHATVFLIKKEKKLCF